MQWIDGSARKAALLQDTNYMVEKIYQLAPYLGHVKHMQCLSYIYMVQKVFLYTKIIVGTWRSTHIIFNLVKKSITFRQKLPLKKNIQQNEEKKLFLISRPMASTC